MNTNDLRPETQALIAQMETAAPGQKSPEFTRYTEGLFGSAVCTSLSDEDATARMNEMPSGTSGGWQICREGEFNDGTPHWPAPPCPDNPMTHRHIYFEA